MTPRRAVRSGLALAGVIGIAAVATGLNLFQFPHYESDEGTYMGSAWAMLAEGKLAYYTYNYDHPPLGWALIAAWTAISGGFFAFGSAVNTGRAFMWIVAVVSAVLLYLTVYRATQRPAAALLAGVLFVVSPLGLDLHRQVWLDNLATFWLLLSIWSLARARESLTGALGSALAFGLSFWTKETSIVFLPGMVYLAYAVPDHRHRRFACAFWVGTALALTSLFVLLASLKDELLPPGVLWSSPEPHVSLIATYLWQMSRGTVNGSIWAFLAQWRIADPPLVLGGLAVAAIGLVIGRDTPLLRGTALLTVSYLAFLARGGVVLYYYVIPLIALLALMLGLAAGHLVNLLAAWEPFRRLRWSAAPAVLGATLLLGGSAIRADQRSFTGNETAAQVAAAKWIDDNLPHDSVILMDSYAWVDLRDPARTGGAPFPNAHYYWPGVSDPAVRSDLLHDDWRSIDYLAFSPSIEADVDKRELPLIPDALANADEVRDFTSDNWSVKILRVRKPHEMEAARDPILSAAWASYQERFMDGGRVVDPGNAGRTTSEGQSYALLRAVYMNDQPAFAQTWTWTREHLQVRDDGLFAWLWGSKPGGGQGVLDANTATDADQDIALALLFASRRWNASQYAEDALKILNGIWEHDTTAQGGSRRVAAGNWGADESSGHVVINPSYLAPYAYRIFQEADPAHDWGALVDSSYELLARIAVEPALGGAAGVVPNWVTLNTQMGALERADQLGQGSSDFAFDASRLPWRLTLDWVWFKDDRARRALAQISLPRRELETNGSLLAAYQSNGAPAADYEALSMYAGTLGGLLFGGDRSLADKVFAEKILHTFTRDDGAAYWGDPNNYYDQNWAWFATALMDGSLGNLWAGETTIPWNQVLSS